MKIVLGRKIILFGKTLTRGERKEQERKKQGKEVRKGNLRNLHGNDSRKCWQCRATENTFDLSVYL